MKLVAAIGMAVCAFAWMGSAEAQQAKLCDKPRQMDGFKTCADVAKAEAEGAFVLYSTDPEAGQQKLVAACKQYLSAHPGTVFFACGTLQKELDRPVNDRQFDVALHVVFESLAAHDAYQDAPLHLKFVEENRANWKQVRVFDSAVEG